MNYDLEDFLEQAIELELNAAEIYAIFSKAVPEDADFWSGLSWEERNHATLLKTARDMFVPADQFPAEMLPAFIQALIESNNWLKIMREKYLKAPPDRQTAFTLALKIEDTAGEKHFQKVMESPSDSKIVKIFQKLCEDDINHYDRIKKYMSEVGETVEIPAERTKRILLVIDDEPVAKLLKTILAIDGEVEVVSNGRDGLRLIKENYYDLIISADDLPIVDGLQFYKEAKTILPDLPKRFLLFTGPPTSDQLSFLKNENLRYLVKPSTINEIRETALKSLADS
jgi:CheY-like chemotaxis protein/rubrerythrin